MQKDIKREIWPAYVKPKDDELFSSWFMRLVREHHCKTNTFINLYFENKPFWNRDIDTWGFNELKNYIYKHTPLEKDDIKMLFLTQYEGNFVEKIEEKGYITGVLRTGIYHRTRKSYGLVFCPSCLAQNNYFKTKWRLYTSLICKDCNVFLRDSCPHCDSPVNFHRLDIGKEILTTENTFSICPNCGKDITYNFENEIRPDLRYIEYQKRVDTIIDEGFCSLTQYPFLYFKVLLILCSRAITTSKLENRLKNGYDRWFNVYNSIESTNDKFILKRIFERREVTVNCFSLFENWPYTYRKFQNFSGITYNDFAKYVDNVPFFFEKELKLM